MPDHNELEAKKLEQGRTLAKKLFSCKESELLNLSKESKQSLKADYPLLSEDEIHNVIILALDAKSRQRKMIALQTLPRNLTLIFISVVTWLARDWKIGLIAGAFSLITLVLFTGQLKTQKLDLFINIAGWLSYLAVFAFGVFLYQTGSSWNIAVLAAVGLWAASLAATWLAGFFLSNMQTAGTKR